VGYPGKEMREVMSNTLQTASRRSFYSRMPSFSRRTSSWIGSRGLGRERFAQVGGARLPVFTVEKYSADSNDHGRH